MSIIKSIIERNTGYISRDPNGVEVGRGSKRDKRYSEIQLYADENKIYGNYKIEQPEVSVGLIAGTLIEGTTPPNSPPTWSSTPSIAWTEGVGGTYNLLNNSSDIDGDAITFTHDATSSPLLTNMSLNANGTITATTGVTEGIRTGIRFFADDGVNAPVVSNDITVTINASTGGFGAKRWNPGHYLKINLDPVDPDQTSYWANAVTKCGANAQDNQMQGALVGIAWGRCNPTGGVFDWSDIYDCLTALNGKQLIVLITYKSFGSSPPGLHAPADLVGEIVSQNQGYTAATWRVAEDGQTEVSQRFSDCMVAFVNEFDANPQVEAVMQVECVPSFGGIAAPADYTALKQSTALQDQYTQVVAALDKMNFAPMINSLSQGGTDYVPDLLEKCYTLGCMIGHPDARGTPGWLGFENDPTGPTVVRDYRLACGCIDIASGSVIITKANLDPDVVINQEQNHQTTHLAWIDYGGLPGDTWAEIIAAIDADPAWNNACPTVYASCAAVPPSEPSITSIGFNFSSLLNTAPGNSVAAEESDNWPITWASDGHQYVSFGDGKGFHNLSGNAETRGSFGFSRIEGTQTGYSAFDVFKSGESMPSSEQGKCYGMLGANAKLYAAVDYYTVGGSGSQADRYHGLSIIMSEDSGASWAQTIRWDSGDWGTGAANQLNGFYSMAFVQFGQDHAKPVSAGSAAATDSYVYAILMEHDDDVYEVQNPGGITLVRCLESNMDLATKSNWSYFSGTPSVPAWSTVLTDRVMIFQDTSATGGNDSSSMFYNEPLDRYVLTTMQNSRYSSTHPTLANTCYIGIYDAPEPWGPWSTVLKTDAEALGLVTGTNGIFWGFSPKWLSGDGLSFVMCGTLLGKDEWGTIEGTFTYG